MIYLSVRLGAYLTCYVRYGDRKPGIPGVVRLALHSREKEGLKAVPAVQPMKRS